MNLTDFHMILLKNYEKRGGPFNWLASEYDFAFYNEMSSEQKKMALTLVYTKHFDVITTQHQGNTPVGRVLLNPIKSQEFFELIMCTSLIHLNKKTKDIKCFSLGRFPLPSEGANTLRLQKQFTYFKDRLDQSDDIWVTDCVKVWGQQTLHQWINDQVAFLQSKIEEDSKKDQKENALLGRATFEVTDYRDLPLKNAFDKLDTLIGLSNVKRNVENLIMRTKYSEVRSAACAVPQQSSFNNFIISGPPGVGKTTSARIIAGIFAASDMLKEKAAIFTTTSALIGEWTGVTERNITELFKRGRGGVIVIDEADSLAPRDAFWASRNHEVAIDTLNALIGYEKDNDTGTIVILTGYEDGITNLLNRNAGLRRRFPNRIAMPAYDGDTLRGIFIQMLKARAYNFANDLVDGALKQIIFAKESMGANFGNAGTIEEFIDVMEAGRAKKIGIDVLRDVASSKNFSSDFVERLSTLYLEEIPRFDKNTKSFVVGHLSLVPTISMETRDQTERAR